MSKSTQCANPSAIASAAIPVARAAINALVQRQWLGPTRCSESGFLIGYTQDVMQFELLDDSGSSCDGLLVGWGFYRLSDGRVTARPKL